jgi:hypothetical protein
MSDTIADPLLTEMMTNAFFRSHGGFAPADASIFSGLLIPWYT